VSEKKYIKLEKVGETANNDTIFKIVEQNFCDDPCLETAQAMIDKLQSLLPEGERHAE
jgi:hypothetical protein